MSRSTTPLSLYAFISWTGLSLPFCHSICYIFITGNDSFRHPPHYVHRGYSELSIKIQVRQEQSGQVQELSQRVLKEPNSIQPIVHVGNNWKEGCRVTKDWVSFPITNTSWDADFKLIVTCLLCVCFPTPFPQTSPFSLSYLGVGGLQFPPSRPLLPYLESHPPFNSPSTPLYYVEVC